MPDPQLCSEEEITELVQRFYARVRRDATLGPIFNERIHDWPAHEAGPERRAVRPLAAAVRADPGHAEDEALCARARELAQRIADSLWYGYQLANPVAETTSDLQELSA